MTAAAPCPDLAAGYHAVPLSGLRVGRRLRMPITDARGVLLLSEGQLITESLLQKIESRRIDQIMVHASELPRLFAGTPQG